ncbi:MAG: hypothetical protein LLG20_22565 [Acidobacteriales bacterium]|nr:hypothetical protein [Terriglobales bacterium]
MIAAGKSGPDAWLEAGYQVKNRDVAKANACEALTNPYIEARVAELRKPQTKKTLSSRDHKRLLAMQLMEDPRQKTQDRLRAMEIDARLAGQFEPDRTEIEVGPKTLLSIKERAAQVASALIRSYETDS